MGEELSECYICYEYVRLSDFFSLNCCSGKRVCVDCLRCLTVPRCPYCRRMIPEIQDRFRQPSSSFIEVNHHLVMEQAHFLADHGLIDESLDPRLVDSRILRRRIRRLRKLQLRERGLSADSRPRPRRPRTQSL